MLQDDRFEEAEDLRRAAAWRWLGARGDRAWEQRAAPDDRGLRPSAWVAGKSWTTAQRPGQGDQCELTQHAYARSLYRAIHAARGDVGAAARCEPLSRRAALRMGRVRSIGRVRRASDHPERELGDHRRGARGSRCRRHRSDRDRVTRTAARPIVEAGRVRVCRRATRGRVERADRHVDELHPVQRSPSCDAEAQRARGCSRASRRPRQADERLVPALDRPVPRARDALPPRPSSARVRRVAGGDARRRRSRADGEAADDLRASASQAVARGRRRAALGDRLTCRAVS